MLLTVQDFRHRVSQDLDALVCDLQDLTGRYSPNEADAWKSSLPKVATAFASPSFQPLHLYFGAQGRLALEYRLPASSSWCDMVLLGRHDANPSAVILELKDWQTRADTPGPVEGLMHRHGTTELHPSDQVRGYTEYCRRFHSTVLDTDASVHGCVLFTRDYFCEPYRLAPNTVLTQQYPCFTLSPQDVQQSLPHFFSTRLTEPDPAFAESFELGRYKQDRGFCKQIAAQLTDPHTSPFELLDGQRKAFSQCVALSSSALFSGTGTTKRKVIIVRGPPGSGKSVVAAKLWANLVSNPLLPEGNVVFCTTSQSQASNWQSLFQSASHEVAARGLVIKANEYIPCTTQDIGRWRRKLNDPTMFTNFEDWRGNLSLINSLRKEGPRTSDQEYLISVVDEAHALINPEHSDARGQFGFAVAAGPQAYHVMRGSVVSIFFLDGEQSFRERETTTVADLTKWAHELGADVIAELSLDGSQFRCAGSKEYVDWVELLLHGHDLKAAKALVPAWHLDGKPSIKASRKSDHQGKFHFHIFDSLFEMEGALRHRLDEGNTARLLASFAREWRTKGLQTPHGLPESAKDFCEKQTHNGKTCTWSRIWNFVPRGDDYSAFIQAPIGTAMHEDPLCEVGCPYAVRGFDYDYVGLLWLNDLKWEKERWVIDPDHVFETGLPRHRGRAHDATDHNHPDVEALLKKIKQAYRILLTRAMKGVYLWFEDPATAKAVNSFLK